MGTDIHTIAQIRASSKWETVAVNIADEVRNYDSFAVMANVRNGRGCAGIVTGERWEPIDNPRGLPKDFDFCRNMYDEPVIYYEDEEKWLGEHSYSWLCLGEIEEYFARIKDKTYRATGVVDVDQYRPDTVPDWYCGSISGTNIKTVTEKEYHAGVPCTHVQQVWDEPCTDRLWYLVEVYNELKSIAKDYNCNYEDVRIVFGFDS